MTSYDSEFDAVLSRGCVYDSAAQLRATPAGTPITDAEGGHWIRGFDDPAERRWQRRTAPRLIWVGIGAIMTGARPRRSLPATHVATEDFWPTTLLEGPPPSMSMGSISGACIGGNPGFSVWDAVEKRNRDFMSSLGKSDTSCGQNRDDPAGRGLGGAIPMQRADLLRDASTAIVAIPDGIHFPGKPG
ncbi:hypothetical protein ACFVWF_28045 [Rhodococcus qingshengii]|uniref:hypothetical protein n=1 Tax=Rhodococcus qingshengii TaxID=334542 RepID=UPI0036DD22B0